MTVFNASVEDLNSATGMPAPLLALNNQFVAELSFLDGARAADLVAKAYMAARIGEADALLLSFDQDAAYDNPNFAWFKARYDRFVYIDRVVVSRAARGRGLARRLYEALLARAARDGHARLVCEINLEPPNPASDAFHAGFGFAPVGQAILPGAGKTVRYFARPIA